MLYYSLYHHAGSRFIVPRPWATFLKENKEQWGRQLKQLQEEKAAAEAEKQKAAEEEEKDKSEQMKKSEATEEEGKREVKFSTSDNDLDDIDFIDREGEDESMREDAK